MILSMKAMSWPAALVVVALLVAVTVLGALGQSVTELVSLGGLILAGLVYGELRGVRENVNGTQQQMVQALRQGMYYSAHSAPMNDTDTEPTPVPPPR